MFRVALAFVLTMAVGSAAIALAPDVSAQLADDDRRISGNVPINGGFGLVVWNGGNLEELRTAADIRGCSLRSAFVTGTGGQFVGYVYGAPALVNEAFLARFAGGNVPSGTPLLLVCNVVTAPAPIDRVDIMRLAIDRLTPSGGIEGSIAYSAAITSGLPGGCVRFDSWDMRREGDTFIITVLNRVPTPNARIACTAIYGQVNTNVPLGERGRELQPGRTYTVRVNDRTVTFEVP